MSFRDEYRIEFDVVFFRMKEERLKKKSEEPSDVLSWVSKSRKLEEKRNIEKERALYLSKVFEEQVSCFLDMFPYVISKLC